MTPREVLARHTSRELSEWMAFFELEPFGPLVEDERAGAIAATILNTTPSKSQKTYQPSDIFPRLKDAAKSDIDDIEENGKKWREFISIFKPKGGA